MNPYDDIVIAQPAPRRPGSRLLIVALVILSAVLIWRLWPSRSGLDPDAEPRAITARGDLAADEKATIDIFRESAPSVVHITTLAVRQDAFSLDLLRIPQGAGSGFLWDQDGHVVTNFHVIQEADAARVTLSDNTTWDAKLVGKYPDRDLAVLLIEAPRDRLRPIPVGTSQDLQVGQKVFAIGNPFGLDQSLTTGVISALGRQIESVTRRPIKDVIQTDAAINPGNSGGPLLDSAGRLIGVNTAIFSPSGVYAGIGFAIPVDEVNRIVPQLIRKGRVERPGLGVGIFADQQARRWGVQGVLVREVQPDGPAAKAGLRPTQWDRAGRIRLGDVIVALDGQRVRGGSDLFAALEQHKIGDTVTVAVLRDGKQEKFDVTLAAIGD
jgi:S1-C subfamily serine protease